ncbi:MAG TPA: chorismate mutase [Bacteroidales bacterium]|jgi:3-deoxy-7-phosphoheptulonate synthase|nr:3-deoxy-7-phosphoheptulonate synthase [Bacteroidales bacterium]HNR42536.1 chorismate mutase [Bacteroidales bacterium]HPM18495.1 chorismate mutase [Bacteroidales bacterium]HPM18508.1 chorismate mutase [Bacteroidales bacterium]HQG76923.1 chorismate mutase [Bacteroidales bacterium]
MVLETGTTHIRDWRGYKGRPFLISGPCSAETEEQVMATAKELAQLKEVNLFRAGIWKPRTRPNSFEGIGIEGLKWLRNVKQETGLMVGTEVANEKHVYEALKYGVDMLWIGARTSVNPFTVQEISNALNGVDVMVLVKNPINPDLDLWIGAIERIARAGISRLGAIHRGFSTYEKTVYRNQPNWQLPIELRRRMPDLPILCDPSHIAGARRYLYEIAQKALDLNFDGLMIESHIDPDKALSDSAQQVTPNDLRELLSRLILRSPVPSDPKLLDILGELRQQIDIFDDYLLDILEKRMKVAETIGQYKKENNITILQSTRWDEIISKVMINGESKGLSRELIDTVFKAIHQESINHQMRVMNNGVMNLAVDKH